MSFYAIVDYTGDGSTRAYSVSFPYLVSTHVEVYVDDVLKAVTADYVWTNSGLITFNSAPGDGLAIRIIRNTPKSSRLVDFTNGSKLIETDLDNSALQLLYIIQEAFDYTTESIASAIPGTLPVPSNPGDDGKILKAAAGEATWSNTVQLATLGVTGDSTFTGMIRAAGNGLKDIGTSIRQFKDLYLSGSLHLGGKDQTTVTVVTGVRWNSTTGTLQIKTRDLLVVPNASEVDWADISAAYADIVV